MNQMEGMLARLRSVSDRFPAEERAKFLSGASTEAIDGLQALLPVPLPNDFVTFLSVCEAVIAMNVWNGYWVGGIVNVTRSVLHPVYSTKVPDEAEESAVVPIAADGGGNDFLLALRSGQVWKRDHETGNARIVAASFTDFLGRVAEDWEHFLSGDDSWRYLSG
ncbi:MAG TPA: SMI1/KNR4 family protein [Tepidisphaeraceae bacterium]|jgi:hypothetical protein|nr:SMI1/KNR4 family protein [Tepidisphaeraceae bacterium]